MKTLLQNLKTILENDTTLQTKVKHYGIGEDELETMVSLGRFPLIVVDRATGLGEEYIPTDSKDLRKRLFHVTVKIAVRIRKRETALLGEDGLLTLFDDVMTAIFSDETVSGRVHELEESITVDEASIISQGEFLGFARQINLTYMTVE
jgi:hypothetical protein